MLSRRSRIKHAISQTAKIVIVVIVIIIIVGGGYGAYTLFNHGTTTTSTGGGSSTSTTTTTTTSTSNTNTVVPSTFTYEETQTYQYLDPQVSYYSFDFNILQNVYETLLAYKGTSGSQVTPWLAANYTMSSNNKTASFALRSGISFADGEQLNSTAVYFSLNRLLITDSSAPSGHGSQASWILQQLENTSLSFVLSGGVSQPYNAAWVQDWLNEHFVNITGTMTFNLNIHNPNAAFPYLLSNVWAGIVAPDYVMSHDLATWTTAGYTLPYKTLSGNSTEMIRQYLVDMASTCNSGATPKGCGATYLDSSTSGSLAGTGPYTIQSTSSTPPGVTLQANPSYWGGPNNNMTAHIKTIVIKQVAQETTRELDLQAAAKSGQAMAVDILPDSLYDVAAKSTWLNNNQLVSDVPGVTLYGPYTYYSTLFDPFSTNVTSPFTGNMYTFQPFADLRFRLAFADAVNMTDIMVNVNNKLGQVATSVVPPGMNPQGTFNSSITPAYSFNPDAAAALLISAMQNPLTTFHYKNGTVAKSGVFNNSFGCTTFTSGVCASAIPQTITLYDAQGDTVDAAILNQIQSVINNISSTYNMGLTVSVSLLPSGTLVTQGTSGQLYMYALGWFADYPWVVDFLNPMYAPGGAYTAGDGWNLTSMFNLGQQAVAATAIGNNTGLVKVTNLMNQIANQNVMYLWTQYPIEFLAMTSNVQGFYFNPSLSTDTGNVAGPQLFAPLY